MLLSGLLAAVWTKLAKRANLQLKREAATMTKRATGLVATTAIVAFVMASRAEAEASAPEAQASTAILDYYPLEARDADVEGRAILGCDLTEHIALRGCHLIYETPSGYGFGRAALRLAALSNGNSAVSARKQSVEINFEFTRHPPSITPDTLTPYHLTTNARWLVWPTGDEIEGAYPRDAKRRGLSGRTVLDCQADLDSRLSGCVVTQEDPVGYGFGAAALAVSKFFKVAPGTRDGAPAGDVHINVPVSFLTLH